MAGAALIRLDGAMEGALCVTTGREAVGWLVLPLPTLMGLETLLPRPNCDPLGFPTGLAPPIRLFASLLRTPARLATWLLREGPAFPGLPLFGAVAG